MLFKKREAIVTIIIGKNYQQNFKKYFYGKWKEYTDKHGMDLVVLTDYIDNSQRGLSRNPSWQKCIAHLDKRVRNYKRTAWIDSDVLITSTAPNIFDYTPLGMVGAVDETSILGNRIVGEKFHEDYGLEPGYHHVFQGGVFVCEPNSHGELFEYVYYNYEEKIANYEMRPLSYYLQKNNVVAWIDQRFNMPWITYYRYIKPYISARHVLIKNDLNKNEISLNDSKLKCLEEAVRKNYFLHFVGKDQSYKLLNKQLHE
ncbi:MAG: hypothetical protein AAGA64_00300 [Bacteroidota bacterium]